ncbi:hypothetical protein J0A68_04515 [Algoriphagus sp. H41]|uniref:Ribbon-helix-helix protein, copG family n=1 Tax=Algoriphagus oliviformis TaxID=2811231 RepID=A0ABS3BZC9_9BACT|nr:DUF6364 family protein [Algoriphagus oliviformis]MBN7810207.1 hypothetical protein [Algoriphagus oliviformis]
MKTKLTLTIDRTTIEKAKAIARQKGSSLSELIENHLNEQIKSATNEELNVPEEFRDLFGSVNFPADLNEKEEIRNILSEKFSR